MIEFISFSSGSCGNCYYIGDGKKGLLIDAGVSARTIKPVLAERGLSFDSFSAILVTHDHLDHIRGLRSFCRMARKRCTNCCRLTFVSSLPNQSFHSHVSRRA